MSPVTFTTAGERIPSLIGASVFLFPGSLGVVLGVLTWFGLTWVANPANGLLMGFTGAIWASAGLGILRFQRWTTVDPAQRAVLRGTRTLFRHPGERYPFENFDRVELRRRALPGGDSASFFVVALSWVGRAGDGSEGPLWLQTFAAEEEARSAASAVAARMGCPLVELGEADR